MRYDPLSLTRYGCDTIFFVSFSVEEIETEIMDLIVLSCQSEMICSFMCDTLMNSKVNSSLLVDMFKNKKFTI